MEIGLSTGPEDVLAANFLASGTLPLNFLMRCAKIWSITRSLLDLYSPHLPDSAQSIRRNMSTITERFNAAEKLKDSGKTEEAIQALEGILADDPDHVLSHLTLGRIYTLAKNFELAIQHGKRACELEPNEPFNFTALSLTYQRTFAGTQDTSYIRLAEDAMAESRRLESLR